MTQTSLTNQVEEIVETVLAELSRRRGAASIQTRPPDIQAPPADLRDGDQGDPLAAANQVAVPNAAHLDALIAMKETTSARLGVWRAGPRYRTITLLKFRADHATAVDAVFRPVSEKFLADLGLFAVQTEVKHKDEYLTRPDLGRRLPPEAVETIKAKCKSNPQVQIIVVDGLSSTAVEANARDVLLALTQGLSALGVTVGTPFFIRYGRVAVQDQVGMALSAEVVVSLIGERPGLATAESISAYMIYRPTKDTIESDRTVVSNIHRGGTPPVEAGAHLATIVKKILDARTSGVKLRL